MAFWCWHKWNKWTTFAAGEDVAAYDALTGRLLLENERYTRGYIEKQQRECEKCGKKQLRTVRC